ncbi:MAG: hypothetical protein WEF86_10315 [Gemmatimonadota bacterium]
MIRVTRRAVAIAAASASAGAACVLAAGCASSLPRLPESRIAEPAPEAVESVLFLLGDAGYADEMRNPLLLRLLDDIEMWSGRLARDSAVGVLFLGDIVYPLGLHSSDSPEFARDSAIVQSQVNLLAGPNAMRYNSLGYFLAGNHDWGEARNVDGVLRLRNLEEFLDRRRAEGIDVRLQPEAGEPGPAVIDFGIQARLVLFDTAWWLLAQSEYRKRRALQQTEDAIRSTEGRYIVVAAHHPFESASSHGGLIPFWKSLGVRFLMTRSGALLQDLSSPAYRELRDIMLEAFRAGPPLYFAGGHDHNLQIIDHQTDGFPWPAFTLVSGSGSKVSDLGHIEGMLYRGEVPGYMRVVTHLSGHVDVFVIAAPTEELLSCPGEGADLERCMIEGSSHFISRYSKRLR